MNSGCILAVEMSGSPGGLALIQTPDGETLHLERFEFPRRSTGPVFSTLAKILGDAPPLVAAVAGIGPGSYNGLRVAISIVEGLSVATGCQVFGVSSLLALPAGCRVVVGNARSGQVYAAAIEEGRFLMPPALMSPQEAAFLPKRFPGFPVCRVGECPGFEEWEQATPCPLRLAEFALRAIKEDPLGVPSPHVPLEPLYLKPPHITAATVAPRPTAPANSGVVTPGEQC